MSNKQNRTTHWGYYIALGLCAAAIGVSGYLYSRGDGDPQVNDPDQTVAGTMDPDDVAVVATKPQTMDPVKENPKPSASTEPTVKKSIRTGYPVAGQTVAVYAMDQLSYNQTTRDWRVHDGLDIGADAGTQVCAAAEGTVYSVFEDDTMGMTVVIRHDDGYVTQYSSLAQEVLVAPGDTVTLGQAIGTVGTTAMLETAVGNHVHFSVTRNGESMDPVDFFDLG